MKNQKLLFIILLGILVILLLIFWPKTKHELSDTKEQDVVSNNPIETRLSSIKTNLLPVAAVSPQRNITNGISRQEKWNLSELQNNVPIDFWGKVVDQDGSPLSGVTIKANVHTIVIGINNMSVDTYPKVEVTTGTDGQFEIRDQKGDVLTIDSVSKDAYEPNSHSLSIYNYTRGFSGDKNNPIIFRLWKEGLHQQLVTGDKIFAFIPDGRPYAMDLLTGAITQAKGAEGDLQFWLARPADAKRHHPYGFSIGIRSPNGGLFKEVNAAFSDMTVAPTVGYTDLYKSDHSENEKHWSGGEWHDRFFVNARGGQIFSRIQVTIDSFFDQKTGLGRVEIEYATNPTGLRILR